MDLNAYSKYEALILRIFLGLTLIFWGYEKLTVVKLGPMYLKEYGKFMILNVESFLRLAGWLQIILGVTIILGLLTRVSSAILALMALITIIIPGAIVMKDIPHFAYAFATAGGAIVLFLKGGGAYSLDERMKIKASQKM
ncbi:MAG: DoxX family protein [Candidatus Hodarchaeales archaeon]|jgi:uncharacterized membrane protein YphA (DoxX/SURF4 family)